MTLDVSEKIEDSHMVGVYSSQYPNGSAVLKLFEDHTFQQTVFETGGKKYSATGKWELSKDGDSYRLYMSDGWWPGLDSEPMRNTGFNTEIYKSGDSI